MNSFEIVAPTIKYLKFYSQFDTVTLGKYSNSFIRNNGKHYKERSAEENRDHLEQITSINQIIDARLYPELYPTLAAL